MAKLKDILRAIFGRPVSGYGSVYAAVVARLRRPGVTVGGTAAYPRVEVHTITEQGWADKGMAVRQLTFTVESVGNASMAATIDLNDANMALLTGEPLAVGDGWRCLGVVPAQLQEMTETSDTNKIIYRILQSYTLWLERTA